MMTSLWRHLSSPSLGRHVTNDVGDYVRSKCFDFVCTATVLKAASACACIRLQTLSTLLGRDTYVSVDLDLPRFYLLFFRPLPSDFAERNSTQTGHMLESKCDLKRHVRNVGHLLPLQLGAQKPLFSTTSQFNDNFNGLYLRIETR